MYLVSDDWKNKIYGNSENIFNIYVNNQLINPDYILKFKIGQELFNNEEFSLGSVTSQYIELTIYKDNLTNMSEEIKVYYGIKIDENYETIPMGIFYIEEIEDDDNVMTIKANDNMIKFEFNYDGSTLEYPCSIKNVLTDICSKAGVELGSTSFLNEDKEISVYDNSISARTYISYIAEQAGGFACIGRDGKLYIRTIGENTAELPIEYFQNFKWGTSFKISRIKYEDGTQIFEAGDETNNTVYINQENMYIVDQEQIDNIYNYLNGLEVYSFEGDSIIDPALDVGDILIIDGRKVIYQGSSQYVGRFKASISSKIQSKEKQETTTKTTSQKVINRRVQSQINQAEGQITQLTQEQSELDGMIAQQTIRIDGINNMVSSTTTKIEDIEQNKVDSEEYNRTIETLTTMIEQGDKQIEFNFKQVSEKTDEISNTVSANQQTLEEYIRFKGALIELGRIGNDFTAELSNTELAFKQNGTKIAYISNNKLYITDAEVQKQLTIGKFAFIPRDNGNLSFTWIGG